MLSILAQTTQEAATQAAKWTAGDWVTVIGAVSALFTVAIIPAIVAYWNGKENAAKIAALQSQTKTLATASDISSTPITPEVVAKVEGIATGMITTNDKPKF